ncbi:MAG: metallophosphoesterase [Desulfurococcales archaeon]|nr:metallophosphoesterase [Desulfurococcales archaeon]
MLIGVMSDSHDNVPNVKKALYVFKENNVRAVIHLGDIVSPFTLKEICNLEIPVYAVFGNNCGEKILLSKIAQDCGVKLSYPPYQIELGESPKRKILMLHGFGSKEQTISLARILAKSGEYDAVLFGHTHEPLVEKHHNTILLNPGEVLGYLSGKASIALLESSTLEGRIIYLD